MIVRSREKDARIFNEVGVTKGNVAGKSGQESMEI